MITDKKYIKIDINKLEEFPDNPRIHDDQDINQLASYIKKAGYIDPVIIDEHNMILAGHRRVLALHELEYEEIDVVQVFGLTDAEKIAYVIADNKLNDNQKWDLDRLHKLASEIVASDLIDSGYTFNDLGFDDNDIERINGMIEGELNSDSDNEIDDDDLNIDEFEPNIGKEKTLEQKEKPLVLIVTFDNQDKQQELFIELRDRGYKVKA